VIRDYTTALAAKIRDGLARALFRIA